MSNTPLYVERECKFSFVLQWGVTVFWRSPVGEDWFQELHASLEPDGIRLFGHRFIEPKCSQFALSTLPSVSPQFVVQRVKGRLQHLIRSRLPKAFARNFAIRGFGEVTRDAIEKYVASQLAHHRMADERVQERLAQFQIENADVDLSQPQQSSHGLYWYNLHIVLVHRDRWCEVREDVLRSLYDMILRASKAKNNLLSRAGILADHVHLVLGCPFQTTPQEIALSYLNNLAHVHGRRPVYQFGAFIGTVGEYDQRAVQSETPLHPDKPGGGGKAMDQVDSGL